MLAALITSFTFLVLSSSAPAPAPKYHASVPSPFYLVTTSSRTQTGNSTTLPRVLSLGLLEPANESAYYLVDEGPGYASYPQFILADGNLHATVPGPEGSEELETVDVVAGSELASRVGETGCGDLSLLHGYLLAVRGRADAWAVCVVDALEGLSYIVDAEANATCTKTFIQAVAKPPFPYSAPSGPLRKL